MTSSSLAPLLLLVSCGLTLDAGRARESEQPSGGSAGRGGAAGANGDGGWNDADLTRLGFALAGTARLEADRAVLTDDAAGPGQVGGVVQRDALDLTVPEPLHVELVFRIYPQQAAPGLPGDGLAVVLHASPLGSAALGRGGGALGYGDLTPCVAVEVDLNRQIPEDLAAPHLAVMPGCNSEQHGPSAQVSSGDPADGAPWLLSVDWSSQSAVLQARLHPLGNDAQITSVDAPLDLVLALGPSAYVAITAATGALKATQTIVSLEVSGGGIGTRRLR